MEFDYRIAYSKRKTIGVIVERDRSITVRAPEGTPEDRIRQAVASKKFWLYEKTREIRKYPENSQRKEVVSGKSLLYLGCHYRLEVVEDETEVIRFDGAFRVPRSLQSSAPSLLRSWYEAQAYAYIAPRAAHFAAAIGVEYHKILISDLRYRWGSCTPANSLNFNWRLIKAPASVIDYVIVHELAHLLEPRHNKRFWNIVAVQSPHYLRAKDWLKQNGAILEIELG